MLEVSLGQSLRTSARLGLWQLASMVISMAVYLTQEDLDAALQDAAYSSSYWKDGCGGAPTWSRSQRELQGWTDARTNTECSALGPWRSGEAACSMGCGRQFPKYNAGYRAGGKSDRETWVEPPLGLAAAYG